MPLYIVAFTEQGGSRRQCRIRAAAGADHITLAVQYMALYQHSCHRVQSGFNVLSANEL
jgi:hypothetical protein